MQKKLIKHGSSLLCPKCSYVLGIAISGRIVSLYCPDCEFEIKINKLDKSDKNIVISSNSYKMLL